MALEALRMSLHLPVDPERIYAAWLDTAQHSAFIGAAAKVEPHPGGAISAWDGYIIGTILELEQGRRIVQTWRASEFTPEHQDSLLEVLLEADDKGGTLLTLNHTGLPKDGATYYRKGWDEFYFKPMRKYFKAGAKKAAAPKAKAGTGTAAKGAKKTAAPAKKAAAKKPAPKKAPVKKAAKKTAAPAKKVAAKKNNGPLSRLNHS